MSKSRNSSVARASSLERYALGNAGLEQIHCGYFIKKAPCLKCRTAGNGIRLQQMSAGRKEKQHYYMCLACGARGPYGKTVGEAKGRWNNANKKGTT